MKRILTWAWRFWVFISRVANDAPSRCTKCNGSLRAGYFLGDDGTCECLKCCGITAQDIVDFIR